MLRLAGVRVASAATLRGNARHVPAIVSSVTARLPAVPASRSLASDPRLVVAPLQASSLRRVSLLLRRSFSDSSAGKGAAPPAASGESSTSTVAPKSAASKSSVPATAKKPTRTRKASSSKKNGSAATSKRKTKPSKTAAAATAANETKTTTTAAAAAAANEAKSAAAAAANEAKSAAAAAASETKAAASKVSQVAAGEAAVNETKAAAGEVASAAGDTGSQAVATGGGVRGWWSRTAPQLRDAANHYWTGTKLLVAETRVAWSLMKKVLHGHTLRRRERRLLMRSAADLFRLVPFSVFIIVPGMEFALPFVLRWFPNLLPSTFEHKHEKEEEARKRLQVKLKMAEFLQTTMEEMLAQDKRAAEGNSRAEVAMRLIQQIREGKTLSSEDTNQLARLFDDELTMDRLARPQLVAMARLLGLPTFGTNAYLRYMLRRHVLKIRKDDAVILFEGLDELSLDELRTANRERGMRGAGSKAVLRRQLENWIELSRNRQIPTTLLILSRAFMLTDQSAAVTDEDLQTTLSAMPSSVLEEIEVQYGDEKQSRSKKLEALKKEQESIAEEIKEQEMWRVRATGEEPADAEAHASPEQQDAAAARAASDSDAAARAAHAAAEAPTSAAPVSPADVVGVVAEESGADLTPQQIQELQEVVRSLSSDSPVEVERDSLESARSNLAYLQSQLADDAAGATAPTTRLATKLTSMMSKLEQQVQATAEQMEGKFAKLDLDRDGRLSLDELKIALRSMKDAPDDETCAKVADSLDEDKDGAVVIEDLMRKHSINLDDISLDTDPEPLEAELDREIEDEKRLLRAVESMTVDASAAAAEVAAGAGADPQQRIDATGSSKSAP